MSQTMTVPELFHKRPVSQLYFIFASLGSWNPSCSWNDICLCTSHPPQPPPRHFPLEWPVTVQMKPLVIMWIAQPLNFASRNGRFHTSSAQHAEWFPEAYAVRQTGVKFASAARNNYIVSLQHRPACGESSWLQENARREKERNPNSSMPRCGIVQASKSFQTLRSAGARGSLWTTFIPKCTAPFAPAGANVHHTRLGEQKEPHEWRSVNVERVG